MYKIKKTGLPPGSLIHIGERKTELVDLHVIDYNKYVLHEEHNCTLEQLQDYEKRDTITWVNVNGLHDENVMERIGQIFKIHPLTLEDVMNTGQRPKIDLYDNYIYIVIKMLNYNPKNDNFESEQLSLVFGRNFVLSFQEEAGDSFDPVRERLRKSTRIREMKSDYLAYALVDVTVDNYYLVLERVGEWIEEMETEIIRRPNVRRTFEINELKRDLSFLRKNIWPVRELINSLLRHEEGIVSKETAMFFKDVYDHTVQVIDNLETYRDGIANLMDLYLSNISYKMNEVMKILTIIATIFIPLTFITSLYGMNFKHMPELEWKYGYFFVLAIIVIIGAGMMYFFKKKKWF